MESVGKPFGKVQTHRIPMEKMNGIYRSHEFRLICKVNVGETKTYHTWMLWERIVLKKIYGNLRKAKCNFGDYRI